MSGRVALDFAMLEPDAHWRKSRRRLDLRWAMILPCRSSDADRGCRSRSSPRRAAGRRPDRQRHFAAGVRRSRPRRPASSASRRHGLQPCATVPPHSARNRRPASASAAAGEGAIRLAAAATRKRAPTPPAPARDTGMPAGRPHRHPVRSRLDRRLQRPGQRRVQRQDHRRDQGVPAQSQVQGNRRAQHAGARPARRRGESQAGAGRLEHGRRCRHRRAARASDQAGAEQEPGQERHPLVFGARPGSGRDLQDQGARHDAGGGVRAAEEGAGDPQARGQLPAARFLHPVGHAGPEEILRARRDQGRRGARHDRPLRPGDRDHHGSGRGRDVERVHAISRRLRRRAGRSDAQAQGGVRHRHRRQRGRPHPHRPRRSPTAAT